MSRSGRRDFVTIFCCAVLIAVILLLWSMQRDAAAAVVAVPLYARRAGVSSSAISGVRITPRQWEVLRVYAVGYSITETGARLGISEQTVKNHLQRIYIELRATNVREALRALGWLKVPEA